MVPDSDNFDRQRLTPHLYTLDKSTSKTTNTGATAIFGLAPAGPAAVAAGRGDAKGHRMTDHSPGTVGASPGYTSASQH